MTRTGRRPGSPAAAIARFLVLFLLLVAAGLVFLESDLVWRSVRQPLCGWLARCTGAVLSPFVSDLVVFGTTVTAPGMSIRVVRQCDGLGALIMLLSGILVFPATRRSRVIGILLGIPLMFVINLARLVILFLLGLQSRWLFDVAHVYAFQVSLVAVAAACFVVWARSATMGRLAQRYGSALSG